MSSYPKSFQYHISRLSNFSRNKLRLATIANTTFNANDQIVIEMPVGLIDLYTLTLQGRLTTANGVVDTGVYAPFIEGCIDSIMVEVGGIAVQSGFTNYNDLFNVLRQYQMADRQTFRQVLQNELTQPPNGPSVLYECQQQPFAVWNWLGFLGSVKVRDTTILPPVKIYIRLAPNSILTSAGVVGASITYRWEDVRATVDVLDISDGVYYNMISSRLAQAPLEIPFTNFQTVIGSQSPTTQTTRWSTSTDCLTDVIAISKPTTFANNSPINNTRLSNYFTREGTNITSAVFSVNGIRFPTIPAENTGPGAGEIFTQTAHVLGVSQDTVGQSEANMSSLSNWNAHYFVHANSFSYSDDDEGHRLVGLSGRGSQLLGTWETSGSSGNIVPIVFLKSKSVLRVGGNRMVEMVL
jgi:hypothetical protein